LKEERSFLGWRVEERFERGVDKTKEERGKKR
jgi:hypothetical protein